jgi:hypothetical protein
MVFLLGEKENEKVLLFNRVMHHLFWAFGLFRGKGKSGVAVRHPHDP